MHTAISSDKIDLSSEKKTEEFASEFIKKLKPGNTVFLYGEMGVGRTTFVRYLVNIFQKANKLKNQGVVYKLDKSKKVITFQLIKLELVSG